MKTKKLNRKCPNCRGSFTPQRDNQRYCGAICRIEFNNDKNNAKRKLLAKKNKPLAKNYDILNALLGDNREKIVHRQFMRGAGFDFRVFTHMDANPENNQPCFGCHEFKYFKVNNENFKIIRND